GRGSTTRSSLRSVRRVTAGCACISSATGTGRLRSMGSASYRHRRTSPPPVSQCAAALIHWRWSTGRRHGGCPGSRAGCWKGRSPRCLWRLCLLVSIVQLRLAETPAQGVLGRQQRRLAVDERPGDGEVGIVPDDRALGFGVVEFVDLVRHL